jgi:hypothetical protein
MSFHIDISVDLYFLLLSWKGIMFFGSVIFLENGLINFVKRRLLKI